MLASLFLGFTTLLRFTIRIADVQNLHFRPIADIRVVKSKCYWAYEATGRYNVTLVPTPYLLVTSTVPL